MQGVAASSSSTLDWAWSHCATLVRDQDPDRYAATLFAPADKQRFLFALYAFSLEIARVRDAVREAIAGELRLQWWRDALQGEARGDVKANPVAAALDETIVRFRLPRQAFVDLIDARLFDLYDDPMPSLTDLEGYCGETSSALIRLASLMLSPEEPGPADAAGHAGVAYAVAGLLRAFPWHARRGQVYVPASVLERHGVDRGQIVEGRSSAGLLAVLREMRGVARTHLERARALSGVVPVSARAAFLPVALVPAFLKGMESRDYDPFTTVVQLSPLHRQWLLWRAARRGV